MTDRTDPPLTPTTTRFWGFGCIAMGAMPMLLAAGMLPSHNGDAPTSAPSWVAALAGATFILAGVALVLRSFLNGDMRDGELPPATPLSIRAIYSLIGLAMIAMLAAVGTWVAFGPGERAFTMSGPLLGSGPADPWIGRAAFGIGAVITWVFFAIAAITWWRKLLRRDPQR